MAGAEASAYTDRERMTTEAYGNSAPLMARSALYDFEENRLDLRKWAFGHVDWNAVTRLLDVGCGPGRYVAEAAVRAPHATLVGTDLSTGMVRETKSAVPSASVGAADAETLPFPDRVFDVTCAMHMLYHVPDIDRAVAELARVTAREGRVLVITNGANHIVEIMELIGASITDVIGAPPDLDARSFSRFSAEGAPGFLEPSLQLEVTERAGNPIRVPDGEVVVRYVDSVRSLFAADLELDAWSSVLERARARVSATIERDGAWSTHSDVALFAGRPR